MFFPQESVNLVERSLSLVMQPSTGPAPADTRAASFWNDDLRALVLGASTACAGVLCHGG